MLLAARVVKKPKNSRLRGGEAEDGGGGEREEGEGGEGEGGGRGRGRGKGRGRERGRGRCSVSPNHLAWVEPIALSQNHCLKNLRQPLPCMIAPFPRPVLLSWSPDYRSQITKLSAKSPGRNTG